jgi:hypothetical protein
MTDSDDVDKLFREAVSTIDAGEIGALERLIVEYPHLTPRSTGACSGR